MAEGPSVASTIQASFNSGELSPLLFGRVDIDKYKSGLALARNVYVDYRGGLSNRAGTQYIDTITSVGTPHLFPFVVNTTTSYVLVFLTGFIRVYSNGLFVEQIVSPYATSDLPNLKYAQSADVLTLVHPSYPIYNFRRTSPTTFTLTLDTPGPIVQPPTNLSGRAQATANTDVYQTYQVTAVSSDGKEESLPTTPLFFTAQGGATPNTQAALKWQPPASGDPPAYYKVYKGATFANRGVSGASPGIPPSIYGYIGQALGTSFFDDNTAPDYSQTPPQFQDPFTPGQVASVQPAVGAFTGYSTSNIAALVFTGGTPTRAAAGYALIDLSTNQPVAVILTDPGAGYGSAPIVTDAVGNATYTVTMGQTSGTFPGAVTYFQQRRTYGGTTNFPESIVMSTTGKYDNFDISPISNASDAITASISSVQNNTIQSLVPMSTGLIAFTYGSAFLLTGGSQSSAVTPSSIVALPQASFGASNLPPIAVNYTVLYTEALGFTVRDLTFNFYYQNYVGVDRSILSSHLFFNYTFNDWAFAESPFRLLHMVRNDGQILVMTYVPEQEMFAWTHYDTNGLFISVATVPEGPSNTIYVLVQRYVQGSKSWQWFLERFVFRNFSSPIDAGMWFVDAGLALAQGAPTATLQPSVADANGNLTLTYSGSLGLTAHVNDIVQAYGCQISLTAVAVGTLTGTILFGSLPTIPNDPFLTPIPLTPGNVTITTPVTVITGLDHLEGMYVTGVADGVVVPPTLVVAGSIALAEPATAVILGLGYTAQALTLRLTAQGAVEDGKRKMIPAVTLRVDQSAGIMVGRDFNNLLPMPASYAPLNPQVQLQSADIRKLLGTKWNKDGQIAIEQSLPLPMTLLADIPEVVLGDTYRA